MSSSTADDNNSAAASDIPPAAQKSRENWDYFNLFNTDHVPAPSLGHPEESVVDKGGGDKFVEAESNPVADFRDQTTPPAGISDKGFFAEPALVQQQKMIRRQRQSGGSSLHHRAGSAGGGSESKRGKMAANNAAHSVNLLLVLKKLDDYFLGAYENANEVSKMLAATRLHYHSNFADNRGDLFLCCYGSMLLCFVDVLLNMFCPALSSVCEST